MTEMDTIYISNFETVKTIFSEVSLTFYEIYYIKH